MDIKLLNSQKLRPLLKLIDQRDTLQAALEKIHAQIEAAFLGTAPAAKAGRKPRRGKAKVAKAPRGRKATAKKAAPKAAKAGKPVKAAKAVKAPKAAKPAKAPKAAKAVKAGGRSARGGMKTKILAALKSAGSKGVSAKELASALKVPNQNIHVWFNSTGSKIEAIEKIGRGQWALKATASSGKEG